MFKPHVPLPFVCPFVRPTPAGFRLCETFLDTFLQFICAASVTLRHTAAHCPTVMKTKMNSAGSVMSLVFRFQHHLLH